MVSDAKTSTAQLDLLMEALKTSIRKALDDDLLLNETRDSQKLDPAKTEPPRKDGGMASEEG